MALCGTHRLVKPVLPTKTPGKPSPSGKKTTIINKKCIYLFNRLFQYLNCYIIIPISSLHTYVPRPVDKICIYQSLSRGASKITWLMGPRLIAVNMQYVTIVKYIVSHSYQLLFHVYGYRWYYLRSQSYECGVVRRLG